MGAIDKIFVAVGADTSGLASGLAGAASMLSRFGGQVGGLSTLLKVGFAGALVGVGVASVAAFANFEEALTRSFAIMGDLSDDMKQKMSDTAREVAKTTLFSATETAGAYYDIASAGLSAAEAIEALPKIAAFAQAGLMDINTAAVYLTDATSALGLKTEDTAQYMENLQRVADVLTQANNMAAGSIEDFSAALTNKAAAALRLTNKSVEEGVAVLMVYAQQGIKGEEAGEKFAIVLRDLQTQAINNKDAFEKYNVAVYDASGNMRNMADIVGDLERATEGMSDETKRATFMELGFQDRSVAAMLSLMGFSDEIRNFQADVENAGGAVEEVSAKQLESFKAKLTLLKDKFIDIGIGIGEKLVPAIEKLLPFFEKIGGAIAWLVEGFSKLPGSVQIAIAAIGTLALLHGPIGALVGAIGGIGTAFQAAAAVGIGSCLAIAAAVAVVVAGLAAIGWAAKEWWEANEDMRTANAQSVTQMAKFGDSVFGVRDTLKDLGYDLSGVGDDFYKLTEVQHEALSQMVADTQEAVKNISPLPDSIIQAWSSKSNQFRTVAHMQMQNYIGEMLVQGGMAKEEAMNVAAGITDGLSSKDPEVKQAAYNTFKLYLAEMVTQGALTTEQARAIMGSISSALELEPSREQEMVSGWLRWKNSLVGLFGEVVGAANGAAAALSNAGGTHSGGVGGTHVAMQHGGIVTRPTLALIGEAGPEAIVPLSKGGMGGLNIYGDINLPGVRDAQGFIHELTRMSQLATIEAVTH